MPLSTGSSFLSARPGCFGILAFPTCGWILSLPCPDVQGPYPVWHVPIPHILGGRATVKGGTLIKRMHPEDREASTPRRSTPSRSTLLGTASTGPGWPQPGRHPALPPQAPRDPGPGSRDQKAEPGLECKAAKDPEGEDPRNKSHTRILATERGLRVPEGRIPSQLSTV